MRDEVRALVALGPLPSEDEATVENLQRIEHVLKSIARPVSNEEATELAKVFGSDGCFGLAWSLLHLIETAPAWPVRDALSNASPLWAEELQRRLPPDVVGALAQHLGEANGGDEV